jgi:hypothetical protein
MSSGLNRYRASQLLIEHDLRKHVAFVAKKNRCAPIGSEPEGKLFRIML